jgi:hypothetical protein
LRDWEPGVVFLLRFDAVFPFPVSFSVAFLFLGQLGGAQLISVGVSVSEGLLRGDDSCSGPDIETLGADACISIKLFGAATLNKVG